MQTSYEIDVKHNLARLVITGDVTEDEMWPSVRDFLSDPHFSPSLSILVDASGVGHITAPEKSVYEIGARVELFDRERVGARVGFLVLADSAAFHLAFSYVAIRADAPYQIEVFTDREACEAFVSGASPKA